MSYPENNPRTRRELANNFVSTWDIQMLRAYVVYAFVEDFYRVPETFEKTWDDFKDSFEWSAEMRESIKKNCPNPGCHCGACAEKNDDYACTPYCEKK